MNMANIPVVSLKDYTQGTAATKQAFIASVGKGLTEFGFFTLVDHGINDDLINAAYNTIAEFFAHDTATKKKYEKAEIFRQRGYTSFGQEHAKDNPKPDLKEFWHVGRTFDPSHALYSKYPQNIWPAEAPKFRNIMSDLYTGLDQCAGSLLEACAIYLGENDALFRDMAKDGDSILRLLHYPPIAGDVPEGAIRSAAHEDINLITLLVNATDAGLELLSKGEWQRIPSHPGSIIVDAGDMLQNITNGIYKSTTHRVVNPDNKNSARYSMPFFVHPRSECSLNPLPSCVDRVGQKTYSDITAGQYLRKRLEEIGLVK